MLIELSLEFSVKELPILVFYSKSRNLTSWGDAVETNGKAMSVELTPTPI